jgi:hypothetical protein
MDVCIMVLRLWALTHIIMTKINDAATGTGTSSSSSSSSRADGGSGGKSSSSVHIINQTPAVAQGFPAIAQLLHWYLQQPVTSWSRLGAGNNEDMLKGMVVQLGILLDAATAAAQRGGNTRPDSQQQTAADQGGIQPAKAAVAARGGRTTAHTPGAGVTTVAGDMLVPGAAKEKVRRIVHEFWPCFQ